MADLIILDRSEREGGTTHLWVSYDGERARFAIDTKTLNGPDGLNIATIMARKATEDIKAARQRGRFRTEDDGGDSGL